MSKVLPGAAGNGESADVLDELRSRTEGPLIGLYASSDDELDHSIEAIAARTEEMRRRRRQRLWAEGQRRVPTGARPSAGVIPIDRARAER